MCLIAKTATRHTRNCALDAEDLRPPRNNSRRSMPLHRQHPAAPQLCFIPASAVAPSYLVVCHTTSTLAGQLRTHTPITRMQREQLTHNPCLHIPKSYPCTPTYHFPLARYLPPPLHACTLPTGPRPNNSYLPPRSRAKPRSTMPVRAQGETPQPVTSTPTAAEGPG